MLDWYLKYGDSRLTQYLYFKGTSFLYIIEVPSVAKTVNSVVFNYFMTKVLSSKLLNGKTNEHTDL